MSSSDIFVASVVGSVALAELVSLSSDWAEVVGTSLDGSEVDGSVASDAMLVGVGDVDDDGATVVVDTEVLAVLVDSTVVTLGADVDVVDGIEEVVAFVELAVVVMFTIVVAVVVDGSVVLLVSSENTTEMRRKTRKTVEWTSTKCRTKAAAEDDLFGSACRLSRRCDDVKRAIVLSPAPALLLRR